MKGPQFFTTSYLYRVIRKDYNPFTPDKLTINNQFIEHRRRNWYLISEDRKVYHFQNVTGIEVNKGLFGANVVIMTAGSGKIVIKGFSKYNVNRIVAYCSQFIEVNTQRSAIEKLGTNLTGTMDKNTEEVVVAISKKSTTAFSLADELLKLKSLLDQNLISEDDFERQKRRLLDN